MAVSLSASRPCKTSALNLLTRRCVTQFPCAEAKIHLHRSPMFSVQTIVRDIEAARGLDEIEEIDRKVSRITTQSPGAP